MQSITEFVRGTLLSAIPTDRGFLIAPPVLSEASGILRLLDNIVHMAFQNRSILCRPTLQMTSFTKAASPRLQLRKQSHSALNHRIGRYVSVRNTTEASADVTSFCVAAVQSALLTFIPILMHFSEGFYLHIGEIIVVFVVCK